MKIFVVKLSNDLFRTKVEIEGELSEGNKTNENLYFLITKTIDFLKAGRNGEPISKKLPIYKYFENKFEVTNLFLIKVIVKREHFIQISLEESLRFCKSF